MGEFFLVITIIVAIVRGLYRFFRWAVRSLKGLTTPAMPPAPMSATAPSSGIEPGRPAPMPRSSAPDALPPPVVTREATTAGFRDREARLQAAEPQSINDVSADGDSPAPGSPPPLFGGTSDLVRALILQEVLGPPLSKRRPPAG